MPIPLVRIPSLDLVRGFVATGRRMSITLAAQDLCLTQSAVSRQIHTLEERLGQKLLVRGHRSITFTPEGERFYQCADNAVQQLQDVIAAIAGVVNRRSVTVTSTIGVAGLWLTPRLSSLLFQYPDIDVRISANSRTLDLKNEGIDLAIRYGSHEAMPEGAERLFGEAIVPVAHPSLALNSLDLPTQLETQILLEFDGPYRPWLHWGEWLNARGWGNVRPKGVLKFNQYDQLIHAAVAGQGVALGRSALILSMLTDGRLVALNPLHDGSSTDHAYWLIRGDEMPRPEVQEVARWITQEATICANFLELQ